MQNINTVLGQVVNLDGKIFVWFTDKFLSGWGCTDGKKHKQIVICSDWATADSIFSNLANNKRFGATYVKKGKYLPNMSRYSVSYRLAEDCPLWSK